MRRNINLLLSVCLFVAFSFQKAVAQIITGDSSSQQNAMNAAVGHLHLSLGHQSGLYNGPEYFSYDPTIQSNAYFMDANAFNSGSVYYDGSIYNGVPMIYDIYSDQLVVLLYNNFSKYALLQEKVKEFDFLDHHFITILTKDIPENGDIKQGYYEEIYDGKLKVLIKQIKTIQASTGGTESASKTFRPAKEYFLKKDGEYYRVSSEGSFLKPLDSRKSQIKQYVKSNQIKFRKDPEDAMVRIAAYYDQITN